jgi:hypothetical protein
MAAAIRRKQMTPSTVAMNLQGKCEELPEKKQNQKQNQNQRVSLQIK